MKDSVSENKKHKGKEIRFPFGYQRRSKDDLFKIFITENQKSLRGFKRGAPIAIMAILICLIVNNTIALIVMTPFALFLLIPIVGFYDVWRIRKKWEEEQNLRRAFVRERILKYGDYGIVFKEKTKNGLSQEKYAWSRYGFIIEWEKWLFLIPAKKKADTFQIREDEIGKENFSEFRDFAQSKLRYQFVSNYKDLI